MRTIAIVNQKGGCGKTTTAINLSAQLARSGQRTLLIDLDPQGHCAAGLNIDESTIEQGIGNLLAADFRYDIGFDDVRKEIGGGLDLVPSRMRLAKLEHADGGIADRHDRDRRLEQVLEFVKDRYAFCIIDCSPSIGLLTFNALRAADETLIPVETGFFAQKGAHRQVKTIELLMKKVGRPADFFLLPTLHREDSPRARAVLDRLRRDFPHQLVPVAIREHEALRESVGMGLPIQEHAPSSEAAADFAALEAWVRNHETTDVVRERARLREEVERKAEAKAARPALSVSRTEAEQEALQDHRPVITTERMDERFKGVLERVRRGGVGSRRGISGTGSAGSEVDSGPLDRSSSQPGHATSITPEEARMLDSDEARFSDSESPAAYGPVVEAGGVRFIQPIGSSRQVALTGDFCGWSPEGIPLTLDPGGRFLEVLVPLEAGRHEYQLIRDGIPGPDPYAAGRTSGPEDEDRSLVHVNQQPVGDLETPPSSGMEPRRT